MGIDNNDNGRSVAMYWDFEKLHAGVLEARYGDGAYPKQDNRFRTPSVGLSATHPYDLRNLRPRQREV